MTTESDAYRCYTSVGVCQTCKSETGEYVIAARQPICEIENGKPSMKIYRLDEFQFLLWYCAHNGIVTEDEMYANASALWERSSPENRRPLFRCCKELQEMGLMIKAEANTLDQSMRDVALQVQPQVLSILDCLRMKNKVAAVRCYMNYLLDKFSMSKTERVLLRYFRQHVGDNFLDYVRANPSVQGTLAFDINNLMQAGHIHPIGTCSGIYNVM